jgi:hypothetical protein
VHSHDQISFLCNAPLRMVLFCRKCSNFESLRKLSKIVLYTHSLCYTLMFNEPAEIDRATTAWRRSNHALCARKAWPVLELIEPWIAFSMNIILAGTIFVVVLSAGFGVLLEIGRPPAYGGRRERIKGPRCDRGCEL